MKRQQPAMTAVIASFALLFPLGGPVYAAETGKPLHAGPATSLQKSGESMDAVRLVPLMYDPVPSDLRVPPPPEVFLREKGLIEVQATVTVNFLPAGPGSFGDTCIAVPPAAQAAFTFAANLWASQLQSPVPISVNACWASNLSPGVLGHAGAVTFYRDFAGAPVAGTWYPIALANALHGSDLDATIGDIYAGFSSTFNWYFGTDGNVPAGQVDLVSVLLHEFGHGLGFSGSMQVSAGSGSWGSGTTSPFAYDRFTENGAVQQLINTALFANPSAALATQLTSNAVFFNGANANAGNGAARVPLYAPATWSAGSSYSHLAESFNGTPNALMTFSLASGESLHNPGPVMLGMFKDMGWVLAAAAPPTFAVTVNRIGTGTGTVVSGPAGVNCGATCTASFPVGTVVTLTATAASGSAFMGWSGAGCVGIGSCTFTVSAATGVSAVFDLPTPSATRLGNISTRGLVLTGNDVMIGGFIIQGTGPLTVVVRARGPSLIPFGITNAMANPVLQLFTGSTFIASNDDWGTAANAAQITASGFAPSHPLESAILITLPPGAYTAIVNGVGGGTGVAIVEVFAQ